MAMKFKEIIYVEDGPIGRSRSTAPRTATCSPKPCVMKSVIASKVSGARPARGSSY